MLYLVINFFYDLSLVQQKYIKLSSMT